MQKSIKIILSSALILLAASMFTACGGGGGGGSTGENNVFNPPDGASTGGGPVPAGGTMTVSVTDYNSGNLISGATVIVVDSADVQQEATTTTSPLKLTIANGCPCTVTAGKTSYDILTFAGINASEINLAIDADTTDAFVEGTAYNFSGNGQVFAAFKVAGGGMYEGCSGCENLSEGTVGFYRLWVPDTNRKHAFSAFDFKNGNFTEATGIGPFSNGETKRVDITFPATPPTPTITTGTITVPSSLGTLYEVRAAGFRDLKDQGLLFVGVPDTGSASPYSYTLETLAAGSEIVAMAEGTSGASTISIKRGVGFGGSGVNFSLIDVPRNLSPTGSCSGTPTFTWTGVTGATLYWVGMEYADSNWTIAIDGSSSSVILPDLSGTNIEGLGLRPGVQVDWEVGTFVVPGHNLNNFSEAIIRDNATDRAISASVTCTP